MQDDERSRHNQGLIELTLNKNTSMRKRTTLTVLTLALAALTTPLTARAADKETKPKPYPLQTCVVSGEKLGEMGDPYVIEYKGQEIKFCCKGCLKDFNKDPDQYIKKLDAQAKAQGKAKGDKDGMHGSDSHEGHQH